MPWVEIGLSNRALFDASVPAVNHFYFQLKGVKRR